MQPGDYYVVLHGARKNAGDFLIRERAVNLLTRFRSDRELIQYPHWESLDDKLDIVNSSKAVIIMGGPGIQVNSYPGVFPLSKNLKNIKVPIILLGVGAYMFPFNERNIHSFKFTDSTIRFLKQCHMVSVRDYFTQRLLNINGVRNVRMVGCPAWFYLDFIGKPAILPTEIKKIVFSVPQRKFFYKQFLNIVDNVILHYPNAYIKVVFNRGINKDKLTTEDADALLNCKDEILSRGLDIDDFAYQVEKFKTIEDFDIHIGYRLHTHIYFCSMRKPSYVIAEDSRSWSNYQTLSIPGFQGFTDQVFSNILPYLKNSMVKTFLFKILPVIKPDIHLHQQIIDRIDYDLSTGFASFEGLDKKMDNAFELTRKFIEKMP